MGMSHHKPYIINQAHKCTLVSFRMYTTRTGAEELGLRGLFVVPEENIRGDDVIITIYRPVPDYVVGRSTSRL